MKEFVANTKGYKVLTPTGYKEFAGVAYMGDKQVFRVEFSEGQFLECTNNHKLFTVDGERVELCNLEINSEILCKDGKTTKITMIKDTGRVEPVYDLIEVGGGHQYFTNGVLSSNCDFVSDDETLIDPLTLTTLKYVEPDFYTGQVRWFKEPEANKTHLVAMDPCLGTGGDYAAIQVFQLPEMIQVAEWQHNKTAPRGQVKTLMQILLLINQSLRENPEQSGEPNIYWTVENNSIGEAFLQIIEDTGEHLFPGFMISEKKKPGQSRRFRKGLNTDNRKKLNACAKLKSLMESNRMTVNSAVLIKQLKNFVSNGASYAAKSGEHDDLVSATLLVVRMLETVISWLGEDEAIDLKEVVDPDDEDNQPLPILL